MAETLTIKLRNKKARAVIKGLEALKVIDIIKEDGIPNKWSARKKKQAKNFLSALREAKLAEEGKIELKTVQSLIDEL